MIFLLCSCLWRCYEPTIVRRESVSVYVMKAYVLGNVKYSGGYPPAGAGSNKPYHGTAGFFKLWEYFCGVTLNVECIFQNGIAFRKRSHE